jgi:hypothetical protein
MRRVDEGLRVHPPTWFHPSHGAREDRELALDEPCPDCCGVAAMVAWASIAGDVLLICNCCGSPFSSIEETQRRQFRETPRWQDFTRLATADDLRGRGWPVEDFFLLPQRA